MSDAALPKLRSELATTWRDARSGLRIVAFEPTRSGPEVQRDVDTAIKQYASTRSLSPELAKQLGGRLGVKYLVVGDVLDYSEGEHTETQRAGQKDETTYDVRTCSFKARIAIFDAETAQLEWEAEDTGSKSERSEQHDSLVGAIVGGSIDAAVNDHPDIAAAAESLFTRMGRFLPSPAK